MSSKQRKELQSLAGSESKIQIYYRDIGRALPPWHIKKSDDYALNQDYELAEAFLRSAQFAGDLAKTPEIQEAIALFTRAMQAVEITREMPRNLNKHRAEIREMFAEGWAILNQLEERGYVFDLTLFY